MLKNVTHIRYKRLLFSVNEYFLSSETTLDADINYFIQCRENISGKLDEFYTLLIDLSQSIDTIRGEIYHRTLSEINSFLANQDFEHKIIFDLPDEDLGHFIDLYNQFASEKKIRKAETFRLKAYKRNGLLAVSYIKQKEKFLCINFYRITKQRAANIYSFTAKDSTVNSSQLGRAHRAIHWLDILKFKKHGVNYYDFCGWYAGHTDKALLNVNTFKEQFTKNKIKEYTGVIYKHKALALFQKLRT